jgi:hypothetical protein
VALNACGGESQSRCSAPSLCDSTPERIDVDEVRERLLSVDLDDRQQLPVTRLELRVTGDVHLFEVELDIGPDRRERRPRPLAEAAARRRVEDDPCRCYG